VLVQVGEDEVLTRGEVFSADPGVALKAVTAGERDHACNVPLSQ
jgi:hypothetical protein